MYSTFCFTAYTYAQDEYKQKQNKQNMQNKFMDVKL